MQVIFNVGAGILLAYASLNLIISVRKGMDPVYLHFGIFSFFAAIYYLVLYQFIPGLLTGTRDSFYFTIAVFSAAAYYGIFPWFIGSLTRSPNLRFQWFISSLYALAFLLFLSFDGNYPYEPWMITSHVALFLLVGYGIQKAYRFSKANGRGNYWIFLTLMVVFLILGVEEVLYAYQKISLPLRDQFDWLPLDLYPLMFVGLMGSKLTSDTYNRYLFEKSLLAQNEKWSLLIHNAKIIVLEIDSNNIIKEANPFFLELTGFPTEKVYGHNLNSFLDREIGSDKILGEPTKDAEYFHKFLKLANGGERLLTLSNVELETPSKETHHLVLGTDITDLQDAYQQLKTIKNQLEKENLALREELIQNVEGIDIIGESPEIKYAINRALQVASTNSTVLLAGETGVGKELFAKLIHQKSNRATNPMVSVNCAALPRELIESELFGHEKGSFTGAYQSRKGRFELANGGTLFLDEIGELPLELQPKLLRVLQAGEFERIGGQKTLKTDVRLISATNRDLPDKIKQNLFREDLYYRVNVYPITIPPLRNRTGDIPTLVSYLVERIGKRLGKRIWNISKANMEALVKHSWPGNIRELENVIERGIISSDGETLHLDKVQSTTSISGAGGLDTQQKEIILKVLEDCSWRINGPGGAAEHLKLHPNTLRSKMKKLKIKRPKEGLKV